MPLIPEQMIDEVQGRADIVELIGRYVPLKRAGRHFKACCPFHQEKTPSFMVNPDKQVFHCFGCGVGGNIFSFLMQHDRLAFPDAVRQLADHVGVRIPEREADDARSRDAEALRALTEKACLFFERRLLDPKAGRAGRAYLERRGVSEATRAAFRLGLAPEGWRQLLTSAATSGVSERQLELAGLAVPGARGAYDRFRNRLMFPITDVRGRVVGFGGRALDDQQPKYLNSPETPLYTKGRHLYGLAQARDAIIQMKTAIVVEGYFDCLVLAGGGIAPVVSPLGTALTEDQARLLKRHADRVILAFDADAAGDQATLRGIDLLVEAGLDVRVARLPRGVDPDEHLRAVGRDRFQALLDASHGLFDALVEHALARHPLTDAESKVRAAQIVLPTIAKVPDAMLRSEYVRLLAQRLRLDETAVTQELAKARPRDAAPTAARALRADAARPATPTPQGPERLLAALLLDDPRRWRQVEGRIALDDVTDPTVREILTIVRALEASQPPPTPAQVVSRLPDPAQAGLVTALVELAQSLASKEVALEDCVRRLLDQRERRTLAALRERIEAAQHAGQTDDVQRLLTDYQQRLPAGRGRQDEGQAGVATVGVAT